MVFSSVQRLLMLFALAGFTALGGCSSNSSLDPLPSGRARVAGSCFSHDTTCTVGAGPWSLAVADLDTNGALDVAVANLGDRTLSILYGDEDALLDGEWSASTTTLLIDSLDYDSTCQSKGVFDTFYPRVIRAVDVDGDTLVDLVLSMLNLDTLEVLPDRLMVLLNQGGSGEGSHIVAFDTLAGIDTRDIFVGGLSGSSGSVDIITAPSSPDMPAITLSRAARTAAGEISLSGTQPEDGAENVSLSTNIYMWFNQDAGSVDQFENQDVVLVTAQFPDQEVPDTIAVEVTKSTRRIDNINYTQYELEPQQELGPYQLVTVSILDSLLGSYQKTYDDGDTWSFTTGGVSLMSVSPSQSERIATDAKFELTFNWDLDGTRTDSTYYYNLTDAAQNLVKNTIVFDSLARTITITPVKRLNPYDEITLSIVPEPIGLKPLIDIRGNPVHGDTLHYQVVGPQVTKTVPANGAVMRFEDYGALVQGITLYFNTDITEVFNNDEIVVHGSVSGSHTVSEINVDDGMKTKVYVTVDGAFMPGEQVTATVTDRFRSLTGDYLLARPYVWSFMIRPSDGVSYSASGSGFTVSASSMTAGRWRPGDDGFGVIYADTLGGFRAALRRSDGWSEETTPVVPDRGWYIIKQADLNNDGLGDIVAARSDSIYCVVFLNTTEDGGDISFAEPGSYDVGDEPSDVFLADFNGDGFIDIATCNLLSNDVSILLNTGDGTFENETYYTVGDHPRAISGADLDSDGDIDIVVANSTGNSVTLLRNTTPTATTPVSGQ